MAKLVAKVSKARLAENDAKKLAALAKRFRTERSCLKEIWRRLKPYKRCPCCRSKRLRVRLGDRLGLCRDCGKKFSLTAGTIFEGMRSPKPYLVAMLAAEENCRFNASILSRICKIAYSTAHAIFKKIMGTVLSAMPDFAQQVPSSEFDEIICKRSLETPARQHPVTEQQDAQNAARESVDVDEFIETKLAVYNLGSTEKCLYKLLSDIPKSYDDIIGETSLAPNAVLGSLTALELFGLAVRLPGDRFVRSGQTFSRYAFDTLDPKVISQIEWVKSAIRKFFHGVSRKNLQIYLAAIWCFFDKGRWGAGSLFERSCLGSQPQMNKFVSPLILQLML